MASGLQRVTGRFEVYAKGRGDFEVIPLYEVVHKQRFGPKDWQVRTEKAVEKGTGLGHVLYEMKIPEKQASLIDLMMGAFGSMEKLFERYEWRLRCKEEREQKKRRVAYHKRRAELAVQRNDESLVKRVKNKQFLRRIEV